MVGKSDSCIYLCLTLWIVRIVSSPSVSLILLLFVSGAIGVACITRIFVIGLTGRMTGHNSGTKRCQTGDTANRSRECSTFHVR